MLQYCCALAVQGMAREEAHSISVSSTAKWSAIPTDKHDPSNPNTRASRCDWDHRLLQVRRGWHTHRPFSDLVAFDTLQPYRYRLRYRRRHYLNWTHSRSVIRN